MVEYISRREAFEILQGTKGKFFSVTFKRRRDSKDGKHKAGDLRTMNCRTNVKKHLKGGTLNYDPKEHYLFSVWDVQAISDTDSGYRMIPIEGIIDIVVDKVRHIVID